jgi:ubiquinone/menaquinone biosynthesis C-methylase UbiE
MASRSPSAYDALIAPLDSFGVRRWRQWAVGSARGRVLEIGVGSGLNLQHYRDAQSIFAIDPNGESMEQAKRRRNGTSVVLHQARAEELPFADASFDAVVGTLTFCSIGEPARALGEVQRVLKPGGAFRLVEHVRTRNRWVAALQDAITPAWSQVAGNCHLNRDTLAAVAQAGFRVQRVHRLIGGLLIGIDAVR